MKIKLQTIESIWDDDTEQFNPVLKEETDWFECSEELAGFIEYTRDYKVVRQIEPDLEHYSTMLEFMKKDNSYPNRFV